MSKNLRKITTWLLGALTCIALVLGIVVSRPQVKTASAAEQAVNFNVAYLEGDTNGKMVLRIDTEGQTWATYHNDQTISQLPSVANYTTINGRTLTELANAYDADIRVTLQPAGTFSFLRVFVPLEVMQTKDVKAMSILEGWTLPSGSTNYTSPAVNYLRVGDTFVNSKNYTANPMWTSANVSISDAQLVHRMYPNPDYLTRGADSYMVDINLGATFPEYDTMYNGYKDIRKYIYINGKTIDDWNTELIAADPRLNEPSTYTYFPQNSTDPTHKEWFVKPIGFWGTTTGFRISIFQEFAATFETIEVTLGAGCVINGNVIAERVSNTVLTQNVVDLTNKLTFLDNSKHNPASWGPTKLYFIHTNNESAWTKAPIGGCLNEGDPSAVGGGQIQMKYIYFNGTSLWDINKNDNSTHGSTQDNILNGGVYAPILVTMSTELGASLKLTVPTSFTIGKAGHEEIVLKKGFNVKEGDTSYVVTSDITYTNNGTTAWDKEVKANEIETEVTGIITKANRTDGGNNENFVIFQLSENDYKGLHTTAITDISSLYGYIDIDGNVVNARPSEPFFNVWGTPNSVAFRAPGLDAAGLQQVKYITIKAGAKFPSYTTQNGGKMLYYVTKEDVTFVHNVPNDTWTVGAAPSSEHTVTFKVGEATYTTQTVTDGSVATAPTAPTKAEDANYTYTFKQWTLNGAAYDFATPVTGDITLVAEFTATQKAAIDITKEIVFAHQSQQYDGTETYLIKTANNYWTKAPIGGCLNEGDTTSAGGGQKQMKYIYFNGKSLYDINKDDNEAYGSAHPNIVQGGIFAPIFVAIGSDGGKYSYIQIHVPTQYADGNHASVELKTGFSVTENGTTWTVTEDIKWVNLNGSWVNEKDTFKADGVTIGNPRLDGAANELYKVDITSTAWTINCNYYDFMYGGQYDAYRKLIFINGVSVYDINANTDDSSYKYSTFPMTGADDATFAHPVLIETYAQNGGNQNKLSIWIHKNYVEALDYDVTITLGAGYNAFTGGKALRENVDFELVFHAVRVDDTVQYVFNGKCAVEPATPHKDMTSTAIYTFDAWYIAGTDEKFSFATPITQDMEIEARFIETSVHLIETEVVGIIHYLKTSDDNWLAFELSVNDYAGAAENFSMGGYQELLRIGFLDKVVLKGSILLNNGTTVSEATLMDIYNSYGPQQGPLLNFWKVQKFGMRLPVGDGVEEIIVKDGCAFPSYAYVSGATETDTRYVVKGDFSYKYDASIGAFAKKSAIELDMHMADGAAVRVTSDMATSGIRFEAKISTEDIDMLYEKLSSGEYTDVELVMLIAPTDYLMGGRFNPDWLGENGYTYLEIIYKLGDLYGHFPKTEGGYHSFFGSIVKLKESNYGRNFSGLGYVKIYKDGGEDVVYASYNPTNSRSASYVANAAINDRSAEKEGIYTQLTENNNYSPYTFSEREFLEGYLTWTEDSAINAQDLTALATKGGWQTITPTTPKLAGAYVELLYKTNVNVWGEFTYTDGNKTATEDFYLQAGTNSHKQYLDIFRYNGVGYGMNTDNLSMTSIKFTNAELASSDAPAGKVKVIALYSQKKTIDTKNQEIHLTVAQNDGSEITVGAHLGLGGALTYLAKSGIYEGVIGGSSGWKNGTVAISTNPNTFDSTNRYKSGSTSSSYSTESGYYGHATSSKPADGAVNLINNFDAGRQIQQSWYAQVGGSDTATDGSNGYDRAYCYTASSTGQWWPYNPVQAGDVVSNPGQIIDYEINESRGYIYVKARAMDWAKGYDPERPCENAVEGGVTTKSYVENYYRLNADGTVKVDNAFIDWNGFTDMESCDWASTELPAVYPVQTLNYYVSNTNGDGTWKDAIEYKNDMKPWSGGTAYHQFANPAQGDTKVEDWFAWANGDNGNAFGMGVYIPNVSRYTSGRSVTTTAYYTDVNFQNSNAKPVPKYTEWFTSKVSDFAQRGNILSDKGMMSNMQEIKYTYQSAYVSNTSYTAPGIDFRMEAYKPIEYSYVICLGTVNKIRETFKDINERGAVTNAGDGYEKVGLDAWARADKTWTW